MINEVLEKNEKESDVYHLWLADTSGSYPREHDDDATIPPITSSWQSSFAGKTVEQAFEFLATIPLDISIDRRTLVVLHKHLYESKDWVVVYEIDEQGEITSIPCATEYTVMYLDSYQWLDWDVNLAQWREDGCPLYKNKASEGVTRQPKLRA